MDGLKALVAAALIATIPASSALAEEPAAFQAMYPDRDVLNGGALTPAGKLGLELPGGAAPNNANAGFDSASPSLRAQRDPSHDPATHTIRSRHGRRHPSR